MIKKINELNRFGRQHGIPVIWIRQVLKADLSDSPKGIKKSGKGVALEGTLGSKLLPELHTESTDKEIIKKRYSGFLGTNFERLIRKSGVDTLVIGGIYTHSCVRMTAIDAYQRDYDVIIAKDCVDSWDEEHRRVTMKYFEPTIAQVKSNEEISELFEK